MKRSAATLALLLDSSLANRFMLDNQTKLMGGLSNKGVHLDKARPYHEFLSVDDVQLVAQTCTSNEERWADASNSQETFDQAIDAKQTWEDPLFTPDRSSLYWSSYPNEKPDHANLNKIDAWKSPKVIDTKREPKFYGTYNKPRPQGIKQNRIGDCWFIAAAAAVAEHPKRLEVIIDQKNRESDYNEAGIFRFNFYVKGELKGINIDDRLPVISYFRSYYEFASKKSDAHAWWLPLMEKAFAKFNQNYDRIQGGSGHESLRQLTNKPVFRYDHSKLSGDQAWNVLHHFNEKNYPAVAGCCRTAPPYGLVSAHAYTLLGTIEVADGDTKHKLAKLRNPWANEKYTGPWSDGSSEWTDDLKKQAKLVSSNDGSFFMPFDLYAKSFYSTNVAILEDFGYEHYWEFSQSTQKKFIKIKNPVKQKLFITVETLSMRLRPEGCTVENWLNLYFYKGSKLLNKDRLGFIGSLMYHDSIGDAFWTDPLDEGDYILIVANWKLDKVPSVDYIVQVSQQSKDKHVTIDGQVGKKTTSAYSGSDFPKEDESYEPSSPTPDSAREKLRKLHDDWFSNIGIPNPFGAMHLLAAHSLALITLFASFNY